MHAIDSDLLERYFLAKSARTIAGFTSVLNKLDICSISSYRVFETFVKIGLSDV